jgi:hypothetical protein
MDVQPVPQALQTICPAEHLYGRYLRWYPKPMAVGPLPALSYDAKGADGSTASHQLGLAAYSTWEFRLEPVRVGIC